MALVPNHVVPDLAVNLAGGGIWSVAQSDSSRFAMMVFYRGLHCPVCRRYLTELEKLLPDFLERGVTAVAISTDDKERAVRAKTEWKLPNLRVGYGLSVEAARTWGLYLSQGRGPTSAGVAEPDFFNEPGLFLVRPDRKMFWANVSSMPFARPHFSEVLGAIDFVIAKNYPARGDA